jgi:hypothetical protein
MSEDTEIGRYQIGGSGILLDTKTGRSWVLVRSLEGNKWEPIPFAEDSPAAPKTN